MFVSAEKARLAAPKRTSAQTSVFNMAEPYHDPRWTINRVFLPLPPARRLIYNRWANGVRMIDDVLEVWRVHEEINRFLLERIPGEGFEAVTLSRNLLLPMRGGRLVQVSGPLDRGLPRG
jgi:hypothetical protein